MRNRLLLLLILLVAAVLRLYGLNNLSPPGLEHDEVAHWLISRSILAGNHAIYFTDAYGHEAGFHYLQTPFIALIGDHALALRLPSAFVGLLGVAVNYALARRLFGQKVALLSAGLLAVLLWPVFYSRLALRAISLPLISSISAYFWWQGWGAGERGRGGAGERGSGGVERAAAWSLSHPLTPSRLLYFSLAGLLAGLSLHSYMAGRSVPIFYALFTLYLALFHWPALKQRSRGILLFWLVGAVVAAPLVIYLSTHPGAEVRIGEVDAPLRALLAGDWRPALENGLKILGMFGFAGDPLWRQYVAGQAVFEPVMATLFYLSLLLCLWRLRDSRYAFLLLWLFTAALPSMVTIDAPSTIRMINMLPVLTLLPAILIHSLDKLSTAFADLSTGAVKLCISLLAILFFYYVGWTTQSLFKIWPHHEEVKFVWQAALTEAAVYLDASPDNGPVALGGWTPESMDPPTMSLALQRGDLALRYFNPTRTLMLPAAAAGQTIRLIRPTILPLDPLLEAKLTTWGASVQSKDSFTLYLLSSSPAPEPQFPADALLGNQLRFLGYDLHLAPQAARLSVLTYWQVTAPADGPRRLYLHLVDANGRLVAQDDGLEAPSVYWQPGDILLQRHSLSWPTAGSVATSHLRLGVYDPESCMPGPCHNLLTGDGAAYIRLRLHQ